MSTDFAFPVVFFYGDDPDDSVITMYDASLTVKSEAYPIYEMTLYALDEETDIITGYASNGMFVCIPDKHMGCRIESLTDLESNHYELLHNGKSINFGEATAISYALKELYELVKVPSKD